MLMLVIDVDGPPVKLPCGCPIYTVKPYSGGKFLDGVYRVEAIAVRQVGTRNEGSLEVPVRHVEWRVHRLAKRDDGGVFIVQSADGDRHVGRFETTVDNLELRCKHHPDYGA